MNSLDKRIVELFAVHAYKQNLSARQTFDDYMAIRSLIDNGHNSRAVMISLLKKAVA